MNKHLRANLWLLGLTLLICSVLYPAALLLIGQTIFPHQANGSLVDDSGDPVYGEEGKAKGSWLVAQEFKGDEYFHSRPSHVSYNGAGTGGSNWGANNYLLRDRVARILGPIVKYKSGAKKGQLVAPDIVTWFRQQKTDAVAAWASAHSGLAQKWITADEAAARFVEEWFEEHPALLAKWKKDNPDNDSPKPEDLAAPFFESFAVEHPGTWLTITETKDAKGETEKKVALVKKTDEDSADIAAVFFDLWRQDHPNVELEDVPADLVMASGSGLDPHITLKNALYQLDRVAANWKKAGKSDVEVRAEIEDIVRKKAAAPLFGLAGVQMVNVLEVNLALKENLELKKAK